MYIHVHLFDLRNATSASQCPNEVSAYRLNVVCLSMARAVPTYLKFIAWLSLPSFMKSKGNSIKVGESFHLWIVSAFLLKILAEDIVSNPYIV